MHIAFLTPEYPHEKVRHSAGIGTSIKNLATALVEEGHQVTLFIYGQQQHQIFTDKKIQFHLIQHKKYHLGGFYLYRKFVQGYINNNCQNIDILEAPDWTGITAFCNYKTPLVIRLHGSDTYFCHLENRPQKKKNFLFEKWALKSAQAITSVSNYTAEVTKELFQLNTSITTIPNFIELDHFQKDSSVSTENYILNFGSVIRKKGVIALAKAFDQLASHNSKIRLMYLGKDVKDITTGKMTSELIKKQLSDEHFERVTFIDQVPYSKVQEYINKALVVCLPSYAEAFPMTWLEAMALEKPLITSDIGWAKELMVHESTGLMVHPDQTSEFVQALDRMINDREFAVQCGTQARKHLEAHFSKTQIIEKNLAFYKSSI